MSEDADKNELPEDAATPPPMDMEVEEIELEPVGEDEGPGGNGGSGASGLLGKGKLSVKDDKTFGMLVHLLGPFTFGIATLAIWLMKKDESPFIEDQGKAAVNFQITVLIAYLALLVVMSLPVIGALIGCFSFLLYSAIGVVNMVFSIMACLKANEGELYRYPYTLRLIK